MQVEYHPSLEQTKVRAFCRDTGLTVMAYGPLGRGRIFEDAALADIARRRGKPLAQIALRWLVQQDNIVPRTGRT